MRELRLNKASSSERPRVSISEEDDRLFLLDLFTHHPNACEKGVDKINSINVVKRGYSNKNSPCFFVSQLHTSKSSKGTIKVQTVVKDISYVKCVSNLGNRFSDKAKEIHSYLMNSDHDFKKIISLIVKILKKYPFSREKVIKHIL